MVYLLWQRDSALVISSNNAIFYKIFISSPKYTRYEFITEKWITKEHIEIKVLEAFAAERTKLSLKGIEDFVCVASIYSSQRSNIQIISEANIWLKNKTRPIIFELNILHPTAEIIKAGPAFTQ